MHKVAILFQTVLVLYSHFLNIYFYSSHQFCMVITVKQLCKYIFFYCKHCTDCSKLKLELAPAIKLELGWLGLASQIQAWLGSGLNKI